MNTYIIDSIRTPIGNFGGTLKDIRTDDLAAIPIRELIKRTKIEPSKIDDVILGCANQAGEDNRNIARMANQAKQSETDLDGGLPEQAKHKKI